MGTTALVLPLADPAADLDSVGGKGASLARLAAAGLPVPDGFHLTTHAYRRFVGDSEARIGEALRGDDAAAVIAAEFAGRDVPPDIAAAIRAALPPGPVAVRSSATAEDLPDLSFAGQHDTFLDVTGDDVLDAVKRCWASLWTERAIAYRARNGITDVALAVVVQEMVPADAAGVLFTANPVTGARTESVVNAAPGLGEALVGGAVTPDEYVVTSGVVRRSGDLLSDAEVLELAGLGERIQDLFGMPVDVEWAVADGRISVLQARPITALPDVPAEDGIAGAGNAEVWNDSLRGDYLWTCANLREAVPSVMTPATWSFAKVLAQPPIAGHPMTGNIGGRFYLNLSVALAVGSALGLGLGGFMLRTTEQYFGRIPPGVELPRLPMSRLAVLRAAVVAAGPFLRQGREYRAKIDGLLASAPDRAERLHAAFLAASTPADLLALWKSDVDEVLRRGRQGVRRGRAQRLDVVAQGPPPFGGAGGGGRRHRVADRSARRGRRVGEFGPAAGLGPPEPGRDHPRGVRPAVRPPVRRRVRGVRAAPGRGPGVARTAGLRSGSRGVAGPAGSRARRGVGTAARRPPRQGGTPAPTGGQARRAGP